MVITLGYLLVVALGNPLGSILEYPNHIALLGSLFGFMAGIILGNPPGSLLGYLVYILHR